MAQESAACTFDSQSFALQSTSIVTTTKIQKCPFRDLVTKIKESVLVQLLTKLECHSNW